MKFRLTLAAAVAQLFLFSFAFGQATVTLTPPIESLGAGATATFRVRYLNETDQPIDAKIQDSLPVTVLTQQGNFTGELKRQLPSEVKGKTLAPKEFIADQYDLKLPENAAGTIVVQLALNKTSRAVLVVASSPAVREAVPSDSAALDRSLVQSSSRPVDTSPQVESGLAEYMANHLSGYEPMYFLYGSDDPNVKFNISFKYRLFNDSGPEWTRWAKGFHVAYTQQSLWDLESESKPFFDSSYKPEFMYQFDNLDFKKSNFISQLGLSAGFVHESNGKSNADSRSMNVVYVRPTVRFGNPDKVHVTLAPRVWAYVGDVDDNPDIKDYRGYGDLRAILSFASGLEISCTSRVGDDWSNGAYQIDATYPLNKLLGGTVDLYFQVQYFNGFGESLLQYNQRTDALRIGIGLVR